MLFNWYSVVKVLRNASSADPIVGMTKHGGDSVSEYRNKLDPDVGAHQALGETSRLAMELFLDREHTTHWYFYPEPKFLRTWGKINSAIRADIAGHLKNRYKMDIWKEDYI